MAERTIGNVLKDVGQGIFNRTVGRLFGAGIGTDSGIVNARASGPAGTTSVIGA